ncbi:MAG: hypothetical protein ACR652_01240 [Methylocystis sp.]|uniref:hypothetical protein n=1 Tax=Methylocystis sp. TaxID=1911079 RepID=UPI003DA610EE
MSNNEERNESEGHIVTVRVRMTEVGDKIVIEPINAALGQSMAVDHEDVVDWGKWNIANKAA